MAKEKAEATQDTGIPKNDAYTGMLVISLLALIGGAVLLYLDKSQYPDNLPPAPSFKAAEPKAPEPKAPEPGKKDGEPAPMPPMPPMPKGPNDGK
jgi:hypothetical protein